MIAVIFQKSFPLIILSPYETACVVDLLPFVAVGFPARYTSVVAMASPPFVGVDIQAAFTSVVAMAIGNQPFAAVVVQATFTFVVVTQSFVGSMDIASAFRVASLVAAFVLLS